MLYADRSFKKSLEFYIQTVIYLQLLRYKIRKRLQFMVTCGYRVSMSMLLVFV